MTTDYDPFDLEPPQEETDARVVDAKGEARQEFDDFLFVMRSKPGRRFVWRLLSWTHVFRTSFTGNSETYFREGERNIGCRIMNEIHSLCPDLYLTMVKEQRDDKRNDSDGSK